VDSWVIDGATGACSGGWRSCGGAAGVGRVAHCWRGGGEMRKNDLEIWFWSSLYLKHLIT